MRKIIAIILCSIIALNSFADRRKDSDDIKIKVNYNLPRTVLDVKVTLERTVFHEGIYAKYAEKYLGVESTNIINNDSEEWTLKNVTMNSRPEIDPTAFYSMELIGEYMPHNLTLSPEGYLLGYNLNVQQKEEFQQENLIYRNQRASKIINTIPERFILDRPFKVVEDTTIMMIETNGEVQQKSKIKGRRQLKTEEEKASDASHIIFKLRKRRFKILTCNYENLPKDGDSYKAIIEQLNNLEQQYLELFFGKTTKETISRTFTIRPTKKEETAIVARYAVSKGFVAANNVSGIPVVLDFKNVAIDKNAIRSLSAKTVSGNYLHYRVPARVNIEIYEGKTRIGYKNMIIPQLGEISYISADGLVDNKLSVEMYPTTGSIKRISKR